MDHFLHAIRDYAIKQLGDLEGVIDARKGEDASTFDLEKQAIRVEIIIRDLNEVLDMANA